MQKRKAIIAGFFSLMLLSHLCAFADALDVDRYAFIAVSPNPVGVGQQVFVCFWLDKWPPTTIGVYSYEGFRVTITKPDNSTEIRETKSDYVGAAYFVYTPDRVGTYYFQFSFPGQNFTAINQYYKPATSKKIALIVQEEKVEYLPEAPLPSEYWARPINSENRDKWWNIAGPWLSMGLQYNFGYDASGNFNPYSTAPNSPHIMWAKPVADGGVVGGELGITDYYTGESYEPK